MDSKRRRLFDLRVATTASVRQILSILRQTQDEPNLVQLATRRTLETALDRETQELFTTLSLPRDDGRAVEIPVVKCEALLPWIVARCDKLRATFAAMHKRRPPTPRHPYKVLFYCDEATPGDVLRLDNKRKCMWLYWTISEASDMHHHDAMWFPLCCVRATLMKEVSGGWSAVFAKVLETLFLDGGFPDAGLLLPGIADERPALWFFAFGHLLADAQAIQFSLSSKGASGTTPCPLCANVCNLGAASLVATDASGLVVDIASSSPERFVRRGSRDLYALADQLRAAHGRATAAEFRRLQQALGLTYNPRGLLWDDRLRDVVPIGEGLLFDAMHVLFSDGEAHTELSLIIDKLARCRFRIDYAKMRTFVNANWRRPSIHNTKPVRLHEAFNTAREAHFRKTNAFGGSASEIRAVVPIVAFMLETVPGLREELPAEAASFAALAKVLREWAKAKHGCVVRGMVDSVKDHCQKKALAYGVEQGVFKFKSHALFHIAQQCEAGQVPDCFVCERLHNAAKERVKDVRNTSSFERSALQRAMLECVHKWDDVDIREGILDAKLATDGAWVSLRCRFRGCMLSAGDVFFDAHRLYLVRGACCFGQESPLYVVVEGYLFVSSPAPGAAYWAQEASEGRDLLPLTEETGAIEIPQWFSHAADGRILTLL